MHPRNCIIFAQVCAYLPPPVRDAQAAFTRKMVDWDRTNWDRITVPGGSVLRRKGQPT